MRSRMCLASGLVLAPLLASELLAQWMVSVGPQRQVNPQGHVWRECSVAARLDVTDEVVAAANFIGPGGGTAYGVSFDGGVSFTTGLADIGLDPGLVVDPLTDRIWLSGLGVKVAYKLPGEAGFSASWQAVNGFDKPLMAIGPDGWHHLARQR